MTAIRAWVFVLTVLLAAAAILIVTLPRTLVDDLDRQAGQHLASSRRAAAMKLRLSSRKWIDTTAKVANDAVLSESLDEATRGPADLQIVHRTVQERLKAFNDQMKVELVLATDAHGRVIARTGTDATTYKDNIEGYPLVGDALRGLRGDDTWAIGGKLYRVAASPVILRDHYVGSVVLGQEVGTELAESMKKDLDCDVVLMLHGRVIASTAALPILDRLPTSAEHASEELLSFDTHFAAVATFPGEASAQHAQYALVLPRRTGSTVQLLSQLVPKDVRAFPPKIVGPIAGGAVVLLLIGFVLISAFGSGPLDRLVRDAQALSRGENGRLPEQAQSGAARTVAQAVNTALDRVAGRARVESRSSVSAAERPVEPIRDAAPSLMPTTPAADVAAVMAATMQSTPILPDALHDELLPSGPTTIMPPPAMAPLLGSSEFDDVKTSAAVRRHLPSLLPSPDVSRDTAPHGASPLPTTDRPTAPAVVRRFDEPATSVESPSEAILLAAANDTTEAVEADFRRVYTEFVATRETCGETLEGVTFDKFVVKLRQNRSQLIERYGCTSVKFQVYIRDGKTALKATPVT